MEILTSGSQVDQFRIIRKLGQGGMSEVYLARDTTLGRKVALKIIRADFVDSPRRLKLFLREAHLTAKFSHQHIITIHFVGEFEGYPYLALEYLEGQTLEERMREGAMSAPETMRVGLAIAQALEEAHVHGVLHRDLKPGNIIIPRDGRLRVLDFGLSKAMKASNHPSVSLPDPSSVPQGENIRADAPLGRTDSLAAQQWLAETLSNTTDELLGTPAYMAPERWLNQDVTGAADLWALGTMMFEMLTGVHPFLSGAESAMDLFNKIAVAPELPTLPPDLDLPEELSHLIAQMLDADPSRRPSSSAVVQKIQGILQRQRAQPVDQRSPFRGLLPFSERHSHLFFGRSAEIEMALERLRHEPILPVVGPSGAGKSSFVAAGIVPRIRELDQWLVLKVRPGTDPFEALGTVIQNGWKWGQGNTLSPTSSIVQIFARHEAGLQAVETIGETELEQRLDKIRETPSSDTEDVPDDASAPYAKKLLNSPAKLLLELQTLADETQGKVLLFVDQLEELYTHDHDPDLRLAYMEAISRAADDPKGPIRVIFSVREDFLGRVAESPSARETLSRIMVLRAPGEEALFETISKPVELAGYSYEDSGLPEEMLDSVRDAPASLPLLQFACSQLWNRRDTEKKLLTRTAYEEMGGVEGALASKADELLTGLTEDQRNVARQMMLRLVTPEGTRRVLTEQELFDGLDTSASLVLNRLTEARMVVARRAKGGDTGKAELELVHDSLISSWRPLVRWLEQSREEVVFLDEVSRAAELWDSRGRPKTEVWTGKALDEALIKIERCDAVPNRVTEFLDSGELQRQTRARRRRKIMLGIIGVLLAVIAAMALMIQITVDQRGRAIALMEEVREKHDREQQARASALREGARAAYIKGDFLEARAKLRGSLEARDSSQARALWWLLENEPLVWSKTLDSFSTRVSVSPDGRLVAVGTMSVNIYDTKTLLRRILSNHKGQVYGLDFSPNGRYLSSGSRDQEIHLWNLRESTFKVLKGHTSAVWATVFSPDGKQLASGSVDKTIKIWNIESDAPIWTLENDSRVLELRFSPNGRFIISVHSDKKIRLWNAKSYQLEQVFEESGIRIIDAVISADEKLLAYGGTDGAIVVQDLETKQKLTRFFGDGSHILSLDFSSNGSLLAATTQDGKVLVWDTEIWSLRYEFQHTKAPVYSVSFLPEVKQLVSVGHDGTLKLWRLVTQSSLKEGAGHRSPIFALAFTPDGEIIATGSGVDGELRFWEVSSSQSIRRICGHDVPLHDIAFNHNGKLLAAGAEDGTIRLYTYPLGQLRKTLYGHRDIVRRVLFSSDGTQLVSSSLDKTIAFWNLESLTLKKSLSTGDVVISMDIDPDGRLLASGSPNAVQVRDVFTSRVLQTFSGHTDIVFSLAFSPDGKSLYSSSYDHTARRYSLDKASIDGEVVARHQEKIHGIDVTHNSGDILGTPSADRTAKIWKVDSGEVLTLKGHRGEVNSLRFSPDGTKAATVSDDCTLRLWDTATGRPLWRAPLMLGEPPLLVTEQGWISFEDDEVPSPSTKQWQKAAQARGRLASATADQQTLCLTSFGDELEMWDIPHDRVTFKTKQPGVQQVLSIRNGCLTLSDESLTLTRATGETVTLGKQVEAISRYEDSLFVLQGGKVCILDLEGNQQDEFQAMAGASALTLTGNSLTLGFPDGRLEVWSRNGSNSSRTFICQEPEGNPVTAIIPGPPGTIIAGFEQGTVGIWSIDTGEQLFSHRLHGPVIHLLLRNQTLYAATELGSKVQFDLSLFYIDYCDLMNRVWSSVFWVWEEGRARYREIPSDHACALRR